MTAKRLCRIGMLALACAGLALVLIPNGMRFTGYLLLGIAAVWEFGLFLHHRAGRSRACKICERVFLAGLTLGIAALVSIEAAVVFRGVADNSADVPVVLSGGQGPGERITEAEAMRRCLEDTGAELLLEERSTSTAENFRYSKALLEEYGLDTETATVAVVTNDFHCFRAHMIAQKQGLRIVDVPAELPWWWLTANYYLREAFAVVKTALFD